MERSADYVDVKQERNNIKPEIWAVVMIYSVLSALTCSNKNFSNKHQRLWLKEIFLKCNFKKYFSKI